MLLFWATTQILNSCALQHFSNEVIRGSLSEEKCVVFHAQHKSAGKTIINVFKTKELEAAIGSEANHTNRFSCDFSTWDCKQNTCSELCDGIGGWLNGCVSEKSNRVVYNGYALRLAGNVNFGSAGTGPCAWATMSREPVSRLVSAFLYCKHVTRKRDPLCGLGSSALDVSEASIQDFAKYWGNYLFREFLWHPELFKLAASRDDFIDDAKCNEKIASPIMPRDSHLTAITGPRAPWQTLQMQLNGGDDPRTPSGAANMKAVEEYLLSGKLYDVIGLVEEWESSMNLFDRFIPLAASKWTGAAAEQIQTHGSETYEEEEKMLLREAANDTEVLDAIAGDIHLYKNVIAPKFISQLGY